MKLQARLLAGIVPAIAIGVLGLGGVAFTELRDSSEEELLRQVDLVVGQTRRQTDSFLDTARANARLFARSTIVERYIRVEDEAERFELMQPSVLDLFASYREAYPSYVEIQVLLPDGYEDTRLSRAGRPNRTEEEATSGFFRTLAAGDGDAVRTAFLLDPDGGEPVFKFGQPIRLKDIRRDPALAREELRGYLVVTAEATALTRQAVRERIGRTGYFFVVADDGTIIDHPDRSRVGTRVEANAMPLAAPALAPEEASAAASRRATTFEGQPVILESARLHDNLTLVGVLPERELRAASSDLAWAVAGVVLPAIGFAVAFFWLLLRRVVLSPLGRLQRIATAIGDGRPEDESGAITARDDEMGRLELAFRDMHGKLARSMTELQGSYSRIHELAFKDALTGLANRRRFLDSLEAGLVEARANRTRLAVLFLDLDDFKKVNDLLGHDAGDELLLEVSRRLDRCLADVAGTCIARLGGDEFIVFVPGAGDDADVSAIGERILASITVPIEVQDQQFVVGSSIGASLYPDDAPDADGLVKCADTAMYAVKQRMKNGMRLYDDDMRLDVERQVRLEADLRLAIPRGELHLAYQPQLAASTGATVGVEALVRWAHPRRGEVSPAEFVPAAEQTGLIEPIGAWIIDESCRQWRAWSMVGVDPGRIAINVSPKQFALHDVATLVDEASRRHGVPPKALEIEITESCMMDAPSSVVDTLGRLRALGVRVAMDDFGTGHSSLAVLGSLPIDTLKIDRSFVSRVNVDAVKGSIMTAVLSLAHDLGLETVAEGVETRSELAFLRKRTCDVVQGYLLARPMGPGEAAEWLRAHARPVAARPVLARAA